MIKKKKKILKKNYYVCVCIRAQVIIKNYIWNNNDKRKDISRILEKKKI